MVVCHARTQHSRGEGGGHQYPPEGVIDTPLPRRPFIKPWVCVRCRRQPASIRTKVEPGRPRWGGEGGGAPPPPLAHGAHRRRSAMQCARHTLRACFEANDQRRRQAKLHVDCWAPAGRFSGAAPTRTCPPPRASQVGRTATTAITSNTARPLEWQAASRAPGRAWRAPGNTNGTRIATAGGWSLGPAGRRGVGVGSGPGPAAPKHIKFAAGVGACCRWCAGTGDGTQVGMDGGGVAGVGVHTRGLALYVFTNRRFTNCSSSDVLPTPASPMMITFM
jgi:hypothetical protein